MDERFRGEDGYVDWCVVLFEAGLCSCDGCGGHLVDGQCIACGCGHQITEPTRFYPRRGVAWFRVPESGRCRHAEAVRAEEEREREHQARRRWLAVEFGDPRR